MPERPIRIALPFALLGALLAVSTSAVFIRFAQADAPSLVIAALRLTCAVLLLTPLAWSRYRGELLDLTRRELMLGLASGLFLAVHFATWISSLEYTSVASSLVFVSTGPLWVALLAPVFLNERLASGAIAGLIVSITGGVIIGLSDACSWGNGLRCPEFGNVLRGAAMWGNFLALAGAWTVSGYLIIGRKLRAGHRLSLIPYVFLVYGMSALVLLLLMFAAGQSPLGYPPRVYGWILLLAVFPQLIGHSIYNWVLGTIPATLVAVVTLLEPIASAILAFLVLREMPTAGVMLGGLLILLGIYLASRSHTPALGPDDS
jgi:drug/metabolite transporter (DMT)-like permease